MPRKRKIARNDGLQLGLNPYVSRFGHVITNSAETTRLSQVLRQGSRSSGRKITLPKLPEPKDKGE